MSLVFEALNAKEGSCLLLTHGPEADPAHVIIDGGVPAVFGMSLKPRLDELRERHQLREGQGLPIELVAVTHIDDDHLGGVLKLAQYAKTHPQELDLHGIWHNAFDDIVGNDKAGSIAAYAGSPSPAVRGFVASVSQGQKLRDLARDLHVPFNQPKKQFPAGLVARQSTGPVSVGFGDLQLTVLAPTPDRLAALEKEWDAYVAEHPAGKVRGGVASTEGPDTPDTSVTNLSSIVLLAEAEGRRLLLTGDAHSDEVIEGLEARGLLSPGGTCAFDVIVIDHHGSRHSSTDAFFARVRADHYVISADGKHGDPHPDTLDRLWKARGGEQGWDLYLTFPRNAFELIEDGEGDAAERKAALQAVQAWLDAHPAIDVHYREPEALGIAIDLPPKAS